VGDAAPLALLVAKHAFVALLRGQRIAHVAADEAMLRVGDAEWRQRLSIVATMYRHCGYMWRLGVGSMYDASTLVVNSQSEPTNLD
jgi:hypothetical protein